MRKVSREARSTAWVLAVLSVLMVQSNSVRAQANEELDWVPMNAPVLVDLRVAEMWKQPTVKEFLDRMAKGKTDLNRGLEKNLGFPPKEIERLLLFLPAPGEPPVFVITASAPVKAKLIAAQLPGAVEKKHQGHSYHVSAAGDLAVYAVDEKFLVFGPTKGVLGALDQKLARKIDSPVHWGADLGKGKAPFSAWVRLDSFGDELKKSLPPQAAAVLPLFDSKYAVAGVVSDTTTRLNVLLTGSDAEDAKKKAQTLRTAVDILRQFIPIGQVELGKLKPKDDEQKWLFGQAETFLKELLEGCKAVKIETRGGAVHGQMEVKVNVGTLLTVAAGALVVTEPARPVKP